MINDMVILLATFWLCSWFLWVFSRVRATRNTEFYVTLVTWLVLVYECVRYQFPAMLTLPQPYRHVQHQAEMLLLAVYGWEAVNYVGHKIVEKTADRLHAEID